MNILFYTSGGIAVLSTFLVITRKNAVHALLYLVVSLLAMAVVFFALGAPFVAALEVIIYAGAIMVLFVFVIMMLNLGGGTARSDSQWLAPAAWGGPAVLCAALLAELALVLAAGKPAAFAAPAIGPVQVGVALLGPYVLAVELASLLLLAGLVGAYHLGRQERTEGGNEGRKT